MNQQLTQARVQFEHFQDAIAHQRSEEQQVFEQRIARLENELTTGLRAKKRNKPCSRNRRRP
ncbi:hypothetical protein FB597_1011009 [Herbaspirillum sp. SJZ099]|nr:hypothetical protein FB597_1011009 [Herbaspirillum sp. SJZ099]